ncbi:hypothetical protein BU26DRAFT_503406 [Trematosphaeria pertusa]|uniref:DUF7730 domain-containing protein n=1 Tax=Trematosphaeria pertusa TaxID=390896 RepID=A0A6A6IL32_9PLEO|nr:uncharacterized protein BU26DRAFT_503406 [Trematosphaeria pertusa]KAF2250778.1 hypothetical protein BU26DRAFT_503406 [Trematosphaeria pertusa]
MHLQFPSVPSTENFSNNMPHTMPSALHKHAAPPKPGRIFPFLHLPAELRIAIYEAALIAPCEVNASFHVRYSPIQGAALLRTCKQIYHEARAILYEKNTFRIDDFRPHLANQCGGGSQHATEWLTRIGAQNANLIRKVATEIRDLASIPCLLSFFTFLKEVCAVPAVEELSVWIDRANWGFSLENESEAELVTQLNAFASLKRLVIGGVIPSWWPEHLPGKIQNGSVKLEFAPAGSLMWVERLADKEENS